MIKALVALLAKGSVSLTFKAEADNQVRVTFTQKPAEGNKVEIPAFSITAAPDNIEAEMCDALTQLAVHRDGSVATMLAEAKAQMDAAAAETKAEAEAKRTKVVAKPVTSKTVTPAASKQAPSFDEVPEEGDDDDDATPAAPVAPLVSAVQPAAATVSLFD